MGVGSSPRQIPRLFSSLQTNRWTILQTENRIQTRTLLRRYHDHHQIIDLISGLIRWSYIRVSLYCRSIVAILRVWLACYFKKLTYAKNLFSVGFQLRFKLWQKPVHKSAAVSMQVGSVDTYRYSMKWFAHLLLFHCCDVERMMSLSNWRHFVVKCWLPWNKCSSLLHK